MFSQISLAACKVRWATGCGGAIPFAQGAWRRRVKPWHKEHRPTAHDMTHPIHVARLSQKEWKLLYEKGTFNRAHQGLGNSLKARKKRRKTHPSKGQAPRQSKAPPSAARSASYGA